MTTIFETVPAFDARTHRRSSAYTDTPDPENERTIRMWGVEPIPYGDLRAAAYPDIGDQMDACMKGFRALLDGGATLPADTVAWVEACEAVKAAHSKPE